MHGLYSFGATGRVVLYWKSQQHLQWGDWPNGIGIIRGMRINLWGEHAWFECKADVLQAHND